MMYKFLSIAKNTFTGIIRQPIYSVIIIIALILFFLSPSIIMYSLDDDNKLLREVGLSTLFLVSLFIAIFSAAGSVAEEIENKTIQTVLSKPIRRPIFIIAKFFGVVGAVVVAHYICSIALLMAVRHGVMETASDMMDWTVISAALISVFGAFLLSALFNYIYDWRFTSTSVVLLAIFGTISIIFMSFIDRDWQFNPANNGINRLDVIGAVLLLLGAIVISALALAFSTRFNIEITLSICIGIFLLGLVSDNVIGGYAAKHIWVKVLYYIVPNLQIYWIADGIYEGSKVTLSYVGMVAGYTAFYAAAILAISTALFQRRQVG